MVTDSAGICGSGGGRALGRPRHRPPCYYLPPLTVRSEQAPWSLKTWQQNMQTRDHQVCRRSTSTAHPAAKRASRPGHGHIVSKTPWKDSLRKISLWLCKMRREREDVCSISSGKYRLHVWSGFIRLLVDGMGRKKKKNICVLVGFLSPKEPTFEKDALIFIQPTCGVTRFSS